MIGAGPGILTFRLPRSRPELRASLCVSTKVLKICKLIDDYLRSSERGQKAVQILAVARGKVMNIYLMR